MSSINAISSYLSGQSKSSSKGATLSEETIGKLLALGIDIESVSSEAEAKRIIAEEEQKKQANSTDKESASQTQEESLLDSIKSLAKKLGINVNDNDNIDKIFNKISERLDELKDNPYNSDFNVLKSEYDMLKQQYKNISTGESSILSAMDLISQSNRAALGI